MKKMLMGLGFILVALLILGKETLGLGNLPVWSIGWTVVFGLLTVKSLFERHWKKASFCGVVTFALLNAIFNWVAISFWSLIIVVFLLWFGLRLLFKPKSSWFIYEGLNNKHSVGVNIGTGATDSDLIFGSATRYVTDDHLTNIGGDVVFSSTSIYFDQAVILGDTASYSGDAVFSSVQLFVPKNWKVEVTGDRVFSTVNSNPSSTPTDKTLVVSGDYVFSRLIVYYI